MINLGWKKEWSRHEAILFTVSLCLTLILYYITNFIEHRAVYEGYYKTYMIEQLPRDYHKINYMAVRSVYILLIVYMGALIYKLNTKKVETEKTLEKLKSESLQSRLDALSNQINPHFFFNALNSLHSLILEDKKEDSLSYLSNLSNIFRYIMRSESGSLVKLKEELAFLEEYKYLLSVKYGDKLFIESNIDPVYLEHKIPGITLMPVIGNVAKHNEISSKNHMVINISAVDGCLVVTNKIKRKIEPVKSEGIGLKNLNNRYKILMNKEIIVKEDGGEFSVILPLLEEKQ
jgi:LytS/YehU family sensor histidine kinase